ncbi:MAG TPA: winged helix-turn-helix transcriptional regulator [Opitutaceae bacterium]|nr:winged helix-turn-helix transcriptional regulator [Opitutaceae bacterium]
MTPLDEQEKAIAKQLIRNPRATDKSISVATGIQLRTVGRKRQKLEKLGVVRYGCSVDLSETGTGEFSACHLYVVKFGIGITVNDIVRAVGSSERLVSNSDIFKETYYAEHDGRLAMISLVEGINDRSIFESIQQRLVSEVLRVLGPGAIEDITTVRILAETRRLRNYVPLVNIKEGIIAADWPDDAIYVAP